MKLGEDTEPDAMGDWLRARTKNIRELIPEMPIEAPTFPNSDAGYQLTVMGRFLLASLNISTQY